jgi:uncharacterized protein YqeY
MSDLKQIINDGIKAGMKAKDKTRLNALRYVKKLFIENDTCGKPIPELDIIIAYAKKVKDSAALYPDGSPQKEEIFAEHKVLSEFLPAQLTKEDVQKFIDEIKANLESPNMGMIMKGLQPKIKGQFDGKLASQMVKDSI